MGSVFSSIMSSSVLWQGYTIREEQVRLSRQRLFDARVVRLGSFGWVGVEASVMHEWMYVTYDYKVSDSEGPCTYGYDLNDWGVIDNWRRR